MKKATTILMFMALAMGGCDDGEKAGQGASASKVGDTASAQPEGSVTPKKSGLDGKELVDLAETYASAVCACENSRCINAAGDKYHEDIDALYADKKARNLTPEQRKQKDAAQAKVKECTKKLLKK